VADVTFAVTAELAGLAVMHLDNELELISVATSQATEASADRHALRIVEPPMSSGSPCPAGPVVEPVALAAFHQGRRPWPG